MATPETGAVLLKDRLPAYISWAPFEGNPAQRAAHQATGLGPIRSGPSLRSGLIRCGRCGLRMAAMYQGSGGRLRYAGRQMAVNYGESFCQSRVGRVVEEG